MKLKYLECISDNECRDYQICNSKVCIDLCVHYQIYEGASVKSQNISLQTTTVLFCAEVYKEYIFSNIYFIVEGSCPNKTLYTLSIDILFY